MISPQTIEEIRNKVDIVSVVSEYIKLRKTGKSYVGLCPFHSEKTPSFTVSPDKQLFHCFGCGEGGNVYTFLTRMENISFADAVKELGSRAGIAVEETGYSGVSRTEKEKLYEVMLLAAGFFRARLEENSGKEPNNCWEAREYLKGRGVSELTAKTFGLGFAPEGWDNLFRHLISRGAAPNQIEGAGLTLPREEKGGYYDRFRNRLMFPVIDLRGRVVAFSGRALKEEEPKYLNSPETPIYRKGEIIFGLNLTKESIKKEKTAILVEGNLDLISAYQAGITNVAAPLGTALTAAQCKLLTRFAETIVLAFDADQAGEAAAARSVELLRAQELKVKVAGLKETKDPDALIQKAGAEAFRKAVSSALPFLEFKIKKTLARYKLAEIEDRSRALREIAGILSGEKDNFIQEEYAKFSSGLLKVGPETILAEIKRQGFYRRGAEKDMRRATEKPASKIIEAEKSLIALAVQNKDFREQVRKEMQIEELTCPESRAIAGLLFNMDPEKSDVSVHFLLENLSDEPARKFLTEALVGEGPKKSERVLNDCIRVIKNERAENRIKSLKIELEKAEKSADSQKTAELLSALKNEIYQGA